MTGIARRLLLNVGKRNIVPASLKQLVQRRFNLFDLRGEKWKVKDPFRNEPSEWTGSGRWPYNLGIFKEFWHLHWNYIAACRDLDVSYKVLDISGPDWLNVVEQSGCDAYLARPSVQSSVWKQMYDERLRILADTGDYLIFPDVKSLWLWESKRKMHYWLEANKIPHPRTWVFYNRKSALEFINKCELPIVYKSDMGSGASGVRIFRRRNDLMKHIERCFGKGFTTYRRLPRDIEWGTVLLQEYISSNVEWRILKIGNSFFGHQKLKVGDFHSGSGQVGWVEPPKQLLDLVRGISVQGGFQSIDIDIFETNEGRYLVNEMQALFGSYLPYQMCIDGKPGRYLWNELQNEWIFEEGVYNKNGSCDLRVKALLRMLELRKGVNAKLLEP